MTWLSPNADSGVRGQQDITRGPKPESRERIRAARPQVGKYSSYNGADQPGTSQAYLLADMQIRLESSRVCSLVVTLRSKWVFSSGSRDEGVVLGPGFADCGYLNPRDCRVLEVKISDSRPASAEKCDTFDPRIVRCAGHVASLRARARGEGLGASR